MGFQARNGRFIAYAPVTGIGHAAAGRSGDSHSGCVYRAGDDGPVLHCEGGAEVAFDA